MKIFGERLRKLREARGLTQIQLGRIVNVSNTTISQYEADRRTPSHPDIIRKLAEFFGTSMDYLCGHDIVALEEQGVPRHIAEILCDLPPGNEDMARVLVKYAKNGASAEEIDEAIRCGLAVKQAMRQMEK